MDIHKFEKVIFVMLNTIYKSRFIDREHLHRRLKISVVEKNEELSTAREI